LLHDGLGGIVVGEFRQVGKGRKCLHETPPEISGLWV
jgi:hypothetical protein